MMDYLKTLGISELLTYLEIESESANFKKVEKIMLSREKNTTKRTDDLEKNLKMHKVKCSELSMELEEMKNVSVSTQSKLEEFKDYKIVCNKLEEKVTCLEQDCKTISEREKSAIQSATSLSTELQRVTAIRNEEVTDFKTKYKDLECAKRKVEDENEAQKTRCKELETDLELYKAKCSELSMVFEDKNKKCTAFESKLEEFKGCQFVCNKLEEKVTRLEQDCKTISEREKSAIQSATSLSMELQRVTWFRNEEATEFKTNYRDLECAKRKAEDENEIQKRRCKELEKMIKCTIILESALEFYKVKCFELSMALEDKNKKCTAFESKLEEFKEYKLMCSELKERVTCLEQDCQIVSEREKRAIQNVSSLSAKLEQVKENSNKELIEYKTKNKDLECAKQKAHDKIETQEKRYKELEKTMKDANELEKNLEMYKGKCSELSMALEEMNKKNIVVEGKLEEFKKDLELYNGKCSDLSTTLVKLMNKNIALEGKLDEYKGIHEKLNEKIARLEEDCMIVSLREKNAIQNINKLSADLEILSRNRNEELVELKTKNKDLECAKLKVEDEIESQKNKYKELEKMMKNAFILEKDLEVYKAKCSELWMALEEKEESISVDSKLEKCKKYKTICNKFQKKVQRLEEDYKIVREREKSANERFKFSLGDLKKLNGDRNRELNELKAKGTNLIYAENKEENEIDVQKKRSKKLKIQMSKVNGQSQVSAKAAVKVGTDVSYKEGKKDEKHLRETSRVVNSAYPLKLKIKLKTPNSEHDGKVCKSAGAGQGEVGPNFAWV